MPLHRSTPIVRFDIGNTEVAEDNGIFHKCYAIREIMQNCRILV